MRAFTSEGPLAAKVQVTWWCDRETPEVAVASQIDFLKKFSGSREEIATAVNLLQALRAEQHLLGLQTARRRGHATPPRRRAQGRERRPACNQRSRGSRRNARAGPDDDPHEAPAQRLSSPPRGEGVAGK
jgi:hypothetical protein